MTSTDTNLTRPVFNLMTKTIYDGITPSNDEFYFVDPEFTGNKFLATDANGEIIETTNVVTDVKIDSTSIVSSGVASVPYATTDNGGVFKLSPGYYGTQMATGVNEGRLMGVTFSYAGYAGVSANTFISKGTLENVITGKGLYQRSVYDGTKAITSGSIALEDSIVFYTDSPSAATTYTIDSTALTQSGLTCRYFNVLINMPSTAVGIDFTTNNTVVWAENETPDMSTGGRTYLLAFQTFDGGTTWIGSLCTWWNTPSA